MNDTSATADELAALAAVKVVFDRGLVTPALLLAYAIVYAVNGWAVFPLRGKIPAIPGASGGHGVLDATTDPATICRWWASITPVPTSVPACPKA